MSLTIQRSDSALKPQTTLEDSNTSQSIRWQNITGTQMAQAPLESQVIFPPKNRKQAEWQAIKIFNRDYINFTKQIKAMVSNGVTSWTGPQLENIFNSLNKFGPHELTRVINKVQGSENVRLFTAKNKQILRQIVANMTSYLGSGNAPAGTNYEYTEKTSAKRFELIGGKPAKGRKKRSEPDIPLLVINIQGLNVHLNGYPLPLPNK